MNNGMYKHKSGLPKKDTGTKTEITIAGRKFELKGQQDTINLMKVSKSQTDAINKLQADNAVLSKNVRALSQQCNELEQKIKNLDKVLKQLGNFGNDYI